MKAEHETASPAQVPEDGAPAPARKIPLVADGQLTELDPRFITAERLGWWIFNGNVALLWIVFVIVNQFTDWVSSGLLRIAIIVSGIALLGVLTWLAQVQPVWVYNHYRYRVTELGIEIRKGVIWRRVISVPRSRIQHTDVSQGPVLRRFGLALLTIHTAGTASATVTLAGVSHRTALAIRDFLLRGGQDDGV